MQITAQIFRYMKVILIQQMNSYILLRDNKETGPFSLDALQQTGLKPTDLIWIECQSMNWRHPHEINELKGLVADDSTSAPVEIKEQITIVDESKTREVTLDPIVEKKLVFVELPKENKPVNEKKKTVFPDPDIADIQKYSGIADFEKPKNEISTAETSIKYSRPLDEIKEMYVKSLEQKGRSKKNISFDLPKKYRQPVIYVALVLAGVVVTLFFKNSGNKKDAVSSQSIQQPITPPISEQIQEEQATTTEIIPVKTEEQIFPTEDAQLILDGEKTKEVPVKKSLPRQQDESLPVSAAIDKTEKNNPSATVITSTKPASAENVSSKLTLHANEYVVGSFGGIRNLEMTLQNNSNYLLDKVTVTVEYLNPEGIILKTENIYFQSVHAGEKETLAVKKSKRGVKITYKITKIESKDISSSTAAL